MEECIIYDNDIYGSEIFSATGILENKILAVQKFGYWPMHPNKLWFIYKVTFNRPRRATQNCEDDSALFIEETGRFSFPVWALQKTLFYCCSGTPMLYQC